MSFFRHLSLCCLALIGLASAQSLPQWLENEQLPPPPASGLLDETGFLARESGIQNRLVSLMHDLERDHQFRFFLVVEPSFISTTTNEYAAKLHQAWVARSDGLVLVFESDTRRIAFGSNIETSEGMLQEEIGVPAYEMMRILSKAVSQADETLPAESYLEALVTKVISEFDGYFERKKIPPPRSQSLKQVLLIVGAVALLSLLVLSVGWALGRSDSKRSMVRLFPEVERPERLGAPYGGGNVSQHEFGTG